MFYGLKTCRDLQNKSVWVETDSALMCFLIQNGFKRTSPHQLLIQAICNMINQDWTVKITHVYRQGNQVADWLSNLTFDLPQGNLFSNPLQGLIRFLLIMLTVWVTFVVPSINRGLDSFVFF